MNYFRLLGVVLCLCFVSCQHRNTNNETILRAEKLLQISPDSTYQLLHSIQQPELMPKADYAAWCLNYIHAQYKLYKKIKSDSLIQVAINYFDNSNLKKQCGTAWYLLGCINIDLHKKKEAMHALKQAELNLNETTEENIKGLVNFNIGNLYMQDELFKESLKYFKKSLHDFILTKNKHYQAYAYRAIADMYNQLKYPPQTAINYLNLAINLAKEAGDTVNYYNNISRKGELMYNTDYSHSKELLLQGFKFIPSQRWEYAAYLSYIYSKLHRQDSVSYYLKIAQQDKYCTNKTLTYLVEAYLDRDNGNHTKAFEDLEKVYNYRDSISQMNILNQLYRIDKQYDLNQKETENASLKIDNRNKVIAITLLIILVLSASVVILFILNLQKKKQAEFSKEKQQLKFEVQLKQIENNQKRELLMSKLQSRIENTLRFNQLKLVTTTPEKQADFIKEISTQFILSEKEWQYYIDEINHLFDGKIISFKTKFEDLTQADFIVISLICLKIDITNCCSLLNMSASTMYTRRKRIKKHIGLGKEVDLEEWVHQNIQ